MHGKHKMKDIVSLHGIPANLAVGADAWGRPGKPQPVIISFDIGYAVGIREAAATDDVSKTMDYGKFYKAVRATLDNRDHGFSDIKALLRVLHNCVPLGDGVEITVYLPKASIRAAGGIRYTDLSAREVGGKLVRKESVSILDIRCTCLLGVNPHERLEKQTVAVDLLFCSSSDDATAVNVHLPCENYPALAKAVAERVEGSSYQTLEALATAVAQTTTMQFGLQQATISVKKPYAIAGIETASVQIHRTRSFFEKSSMWTSS